ncbi:MAG: polysaccharide deacetylase family protein [bacterium]
MKKTLLIMVLFTLSFISAQNKYVTITMDDLPFTAFTSKTTNLDSLEKFNNQLITDINNNNIPVTIFVNENDIIHINETDRRINIYNNLISNFLVTVGNHTYNHLNFAQVKQHEFENSIISGEVITKKLIEPTNKELKYFRFPYNCTCKDSISKTLIDSFLVKNNYISTPFTIESSDYVFNLLYVNYLEKNEPDSAKLIAEEYINFTKKLFEYFEEFTQKEYGRNINHIFLCHGNKLHADYFENLINMLKNCGYTFISLDETLKDKVYNQKDYYYYKWGVSWLYRWIKDSSKRKSLMRIEPEINPEIYKLYEAINK